MSEYSAFFLNAKSDVIQLELLELSHPNFSQTYYIVRNAVAGVTVTHEDASVHAYTYYPLQIKSNGARDNLDVGFQINLGDLGEIFPLEMDRIANAGGFGIKPVVKYRSYRSDVLTVPLTGPFILEITQISHNEDGVTFEAQAPLLNINRTGEIYDLDRFPMLRGFL